MSIRALLKGVETRVRSSVVLDDAEGKLCGIQDTAKPPPFNGQLYYSIHWSGASATQQPGQTEVEYTDTYHAITVTITARMNYAPQDRRGKVISDSLGLLDLADALAAPNVIHGNYDVLATANALIPNTAQYLTAKGLDPAGATTNGYIEPLWLLDFGPIQEMGGDWVGAERGKSLDVFTLPVRFTKARRVTVQ